MANEVLLKVKITDDGTLQVVGDKAEKAAQKTEKLTKSGDKLNKQQKTTYRTMQ